MSELLILTTNSLKTKLKKLKIMKHLFVMTLALILSVSASAQSISSGMINLDCTMDVALTKGETHAKVFILKGE
jgi:hypothetical protein